MIRSQAAALIQHPLMHEFHETIVAGRIAAAREGALACKEKEKRCQLMDRGDSEAVSIVTNSDSVLANDGSSLGNVSRFDLCYDEDVLTT